MSKHASDPNLYQGPDHVTQMLTPDSLSADSLPSADEITMAKTELLFGQKKPEDEPIRRYMEKVTDISG